MEPKTRIKNLTKALQGNTHKVYLTKNKSQCCPYKYYFLHNIVPAIAADTALTVAVLAVAVLAVAVLAVAANTA